MAELTGACMCGAVRFEIAKPLLGALYCHCKRCQRRTGTAFSATALTEPGTFSVTAGEDRVASWDPADGGWVKMFCRDCGSQLYTVHADNRDLIAVRMGAVDGDPGVRPNVHQFVTYAPEWWPVPDDGFPRFPERMGATEPL